MLFQSAAVQTKVQNSWLHSILFLALVSFSSSLAALDCKNVEYLTKTFNRAHYSVKKFDDKLSEKVFQQFVKSWDPSKIYFYKADVDSLQATYGMKLDDQIPAVNCEFIEKVANLYGKRFQERYEYLKVILKMKHDFTKEEFLEVDAKKMDFSSNVEELNDRWRKRIKFQIMGLKKTTKSVQEAAAKLEGRYGRMLKAHQKESMDKVYDRFLKAFSSALDPHTDYMSPDDLEEFRISNNLSLEGIGAVLRSEDGVTIIQSIMPGGAAFNDGRLKVGDKIIAVAQENGAPVDVIDMDLKDVVKLIRGKPKTKVILTILRETSGESKQMVLDIVREKIQLTDGAARSKVFSVKSKRPGEENLIKVGVLELPGFYVNFEDQQADKPDYVSSSRDTLRELDKLKKEKVDSIVFDLRMNGGGSLPESIKIAGLFFDKGPVVQIKEADGKIFPQVDVDSSTQYDGPLVVLISRQSASASEIFAGAIKDYERGVIVGSDHTFGKGTVQNLNNLGQKLGASKVTISKFYRPSGASTQLKGVDSDVIFPSVIDLIDIGEKFYDYALEWDRIPSSSFTPKNMVKPYLSSLTERSSQRVKMDQEFKEIAKAIKEWEENKGNREKVSLKEDDKKKTPDEDEAEENKEPSKTIVLEGDAHLQEAVRVAADYGMLIKKKNPGDLTLVGLKPKEKKPSSQASDKKPGKAKVKDSAAKSPLESGAPDKNPGTTYLKQDLISPTPSSK